MIFIGLICFALTIAAKALFAVTIFALFPKVIITIAVLFCVVCLMIGACCDGGSSTKPNTRS